MADPGIEVAGEITVDALSAGVETLISPAPGPGASPTPAPGPGSIGDDDSGKLFGLPMIPLVAAVGGVALMALGLIVRHRAAKRFQVTNAIAMSQPANPAGGDSIERKFSDEHDYEHTNPMRQGNEPVWDGKV